MSFKARFLVDLQAKSLAPCDAIIVADGRPHRYRIDGDKHGSSHGCYALRLDPIPCGYAGSFRTGKAHAWRDPEARPINRVESSILHRHMREMRQQRYQVQLEAWSEVRSSAEKLWRTARPADTHPFLLKEHVKPFGIRKLRDMLLIPARDMDGQIHSLQFILKDGSNRFLSGGRLDRCYYSIGRPGDVLYVCECYATAARIHDATGHAVAVAFTLENLVPVWRRMFIKFPRTKIIIATTDDSVMPDGQGFIPIHHASKIITGECDGQ